MIKSYDGRGEDIAATLKDEGVVFGISLGRRAPLHTMHVDCLREIVDAGLTPVVVIGSVNSPESALYDPVRNPLTLAQQEEQLRRLFTEKNWPEPVIVSLPDHPDDAVWMQDLLTSLRKAGINPEQSVMHFRGKAADAEKLNDKIKPLGQYARSLLENGLGVWQSYNSRKEDDLISASAIRAADFNNLPLDLKGTIAVSDTLLEMTRKARADNPDRGVLDALGLPVTMMDLTFDRLRREAGVATKAVLDKAGEKGDVDMTRIAEAIKDICDARRHKKPMLLLCDSVSSETARTLQDSDAFDIVTCNLGSFQSGEPFSELFYKDARGYQVNRERLEGAEVFVVQSTAAPVAEHVQHLLESIHTLKYYGAKKVTAVIPFSAFARQDRSFGQRFTSVAAELFPLQLKAAGADAVMTISLHSDAAAQFYRKVFGDQFQKLSSADIFADYFKSQPGFNPATTRIGAPDGADKPHDDGQRRARNLSAALTPCFNQAASMFFIAKQHVAASETKITSFTGDVTGMDCIVVDDMVDGGSTLINAAKLLKQRGARSVTCCVTHGILSPSNGQAALDKIMAAVEDGKYAVDKLVMTDAVPEAVAKVQDWQSRNTDAAGRITVISIGSVLMTAMRPKPAPGARPVAALPVP
jgi:ribose-phosphate pyrophosphokinase